MMGKTCWVCGNKLPDVAVEKLCTPIAELNLSNRTFNTLTRAKITYIEQLLRLDQDEIFLIRNMGKITFNEIKEKVAELGFVCWN